MFIRACAFDYSEELSGSYNYEQEDDIHNWIVKRIGKKTDNAIPPVIIDYNYDENLIFQRRR
jgi:hypothetical protein